MELKFNINTYECLFRFSYEGRSSEIISDGKSLMVGSCQLSQGEVAALMYCSSQFEAGMEKPEHWTAIEIRVLPDMHVAAQINDGRVVVTGTDDGALVELISAAATGMEARAPWNSDIDFGIPEIEGAKAYLAGWSSHSDPYRNKNDGNGEKWRSGWEIAKHISAETNQRGNEIG